MSGAMLLNALDGSNPLGFLAANGTMRLLHLSHPEVGLQMYWERLQGSWRPTLIGLGGNQQEICELLMDASWAPADDLEMVGKNITIPKEKFKLFVEAAHSQATPKDRRLADFVSSFGSEVRDNPGKGRIEYTDFCFITGSGHQDFLGTIGALGERVTLEHIHEALFGTWKMEKSLSMRWDPADATEYALQWDDPGPKGAWAVWGANRLAAEALPCFPAMPVKGGLQTTGFFKARNRPNEFTWPIWNQPAGFDTIRSLLSLSDWRQLEFPLNDN